MSGGRKPEWSQDVRRTVVARVLDDGRTLNSVVRDLKAGLLEGLEPTPVPYSTARRWCDQEKARRARNIRPDVAAYNAAAERLWRVIGRELDKLEREGRKAKALEPKRVREMLGTLREAKALIVQPKGKPTSNQDPDQDSDQTDAKPDFLASLPDPEADGEDPSAPDPSQPHTDGESDGASTAATSDAMADGHVLTSATS